MKKRFKKLVTFSVALGLMVGILPVTSFAAADPNSDLPLQSKASIIAKSNIEILAHLTPDQLKNYNQKLADGYKVDVEQKGDYTYINAYKPSTSLESLSTSNLTTGATTNSLIQPLSIVGSIHVDQTIYYVKRFMGTETGDIDISIANSTSVSITSFSLFGPLTSTYRGSGYITPTGNPAKIYYDFSIFYGISYETAMTIPFHTILSVYPNGTLKFYNDQSYY